MDFLTILGINSAIVVAIVGVSEFAKMFDKKETLKRLYILLPLIFAFVAGLLMTTPFKWQTVGYNTFLYFGISTLSYGVVKKTVLGKSGKNLIDIIVNKDKLPGDK